MLAIVLAVACAAPALASPPTAYADQSQTEAASAGTHIHILPFAGTDAIVLESNGRFGIVDSGEDSDYPDGSDPRYPLRPGIVKGSGVEDAVVAYLKNLGVNSGNLEFYLGTHPHSDHIAPPTRSSASSAPSACTWLNIRIHSYRTKLASGTTSTCTTELSLRRKRRAPS